MDAEHAKDEDAATAPPAPPTAVRVGPLMMGVTFLAVAIVALAMNPDGFDERAILLWPITVLILTAGSLVALIAHMTTRRRA